MSNKAPTALCWRIGQIMGGAPGHTVPHAWFDRLTVTQQLGRKATEVQRPYLEAILILADICYWYRPSDKEDDSGNIYYERKFAGDLLQRSYDQYSDRYGFGKDQTRNAMKWLQEQGLIVLEFRTIERGGRRMNNVLYVKPIPDEIERITLPQDIQEPVPPLEKSKTPVGMHTDRLLVCIPTGSQYANRESPGMHTETNTYITPEITSQTTAEKTAPEGAGFEAAALADELFSTQEPAVVSPPARPQRLPSDPLGMAVHCQDVKEKTGGNWAEPPQAGGDDPIAEAMLLAWLEGQGLDPVTLIDADRKKLLKAFSRLAGEVNGITAHIAGQAVRLILDKDPTKNPAFYWYTYTSPSVQKFKDDWKLTAQRLLSGQPGIEPIQQGGGPVQKKLTGLAALRELARKEESNGE